jgi:hypothetical protein
MHTDDVEISLPRLNQQSLFLTNSSTESSRQHYLCSTTHNVRMEFVRKSMTWSALP